VPETEGGRHSALVLLSDDEMCVSGSIFKFLRSVSDNVANVNVEGSTPFARFLSLENTKT
jgi:hypothetical protein